MLNYEKFHQNFRLNEPATHIFKAVHIFRCNSIPVLLGISNKNNNNFFICIGDSVKHNVGLSKIKYMSMKHHDMLFLFVSNHVMLIFYSV